MFFEHDVKIRAAETIGADAGAPRRSDRGFPLLQVMVDEEGCVGKYDVGIGLFGVERGGQHPVVHRHDRLEQPGRAGACLQVADVALGRADGNAAARRVGEDRGQAFDFDHVADFGAGAVRFDQGGAGRIEAGVFPGALRGQLLADGVGGGDALPLAITAAAHAADGAVNLVAVAFGVGQALEQKERSAFAHHEAVGAVAKGAAAGGAEGADLAELDEGRRPHVAIYTAGQHRIAAVVDEVFDRRFDGGEGGGAGGVGDEARPAQVEGVGDAAGDDVGQFAGHRVLGDGGNPGLDDFAPFGDQRSA